MEDLSALTRSFDAFASKTDEVLKKLVESSATVDSVEGVKAQLMELEQQFVARGAMRSGGLSSPGGSDLQRTLETAASFQAVVKREAKSGIVPVSGRALLQTRAILNDGTVLAPATRKEGILAPLPQRSWLRDRIPVLTAHGATVEWVRETGFTNNAGPQYSDGARENVRKPESNLTFGLENSSIPTIAHFIKASRQALSDSDQLRAYVEARLLYGMEAVVEAEIIAGDGTGGHMTGLLAPANHTAFVPASDSEQYLDFLRDAVTQLQMQEFNQRRRFGYRRLHILLRREGIMINRKKTQRLYKEEGLAVRRRRSRRRAVGTRAPAPVLALPNQCWSLDFVHDQMASGRRFRVLNVVDDVTRECLAAVPDVTVTRYSGARV